MIGCLIWQGHLNYNKDIWTITRTFIVYFSTTTRTFEQGATISYYPKMNQHIPTPFSKCNSCTIIYESLYSLRSCFSCFRDTIVPDGQLAKINMLSTVHTVQLFKDNFEGSLYFLLTDRLFYFFANCPSGTIFYSSGTYWFVSGARQGSRLSTDT